MSYFFDCLLSCQAGLDCRLKIDDPVDEKLEHAPEDLLHQSYQADLDYALVAVPLALVDAPVVVASATAATGTTCSALRPHSYFTNANSKIKSYVRSKFQITEADRDSRTRVSIESLTF